MLSLAISLLYSAQLDNELKKAEFLRAFSLFIENIYSDSINSFCASSDVDSANALHQQLSFISKHIQYLPILKVGKTLLIETYRDIYDDNFPFAYITYKLCYVKDLHSLHPEAFENLRDDDFCLFIQEEYGTSIHNKTIISQSAIVFSYENYKVVACPRLLDNRKAIS